MTAATVPAEGHHSITRIDQFVSLGVVCRPWLEPVEPQLPEPLGSGVGLATLPHGHGFKARVEQGRKSLDGPLERLSSRTSAATSVSGGGITARASSTFSFDIAGKLSRALVALSGSKRAATDWLHI
jgi:hypothetical protein